MIAFQTNVITDLKGIIEIIPATTPTIILRSNVPHALAKEWSTEIFPFRYLDRIAIFISHMDNFWSWTWPCKQYDRPGMLAGWDHVLNKHITPAHAHFLGRVGARNKLMLTMRYTKPGWGQLSPRIVAYLHTLWCTRVAPPARQSSLTNSLSWKRPQRIICMWRADVNFSLFRNSFGIEWRSMILLLRTNWIMNEHDTLNIELHF